VDLAPGCRGKVRGLVSPAASDGPRGARHTNSATRAPPGALLSGALVAAASGLDGCVPAPDALTVGQVSKLAGDLLTVWLVIPADLPDGDADAFADMRAPCPRGGVRADAGCGGLAVRVLPAGTQAAHAGPPADRTLSAWRWLHPAECIGSRSAWPPASRCRRRPPPGTSGSTTSEPRSTLMTGRLRMARWPRAVSARPSIALTARRPGPGSRPPQPAAGGVRKAEAGTGPSRNVRADRSRRCARLVPWT
jgi:hypothetical protein